MTTPTQRTVVISGAGSPRGIGRAVAQRMAKDGWAVAVADIDETAAGRTARLLSESGVPALGMGCDVTDEASVLAFRDAVATDSSMPTVGAVFPIAGVTAPMDFVDSSLADWNRVIAVNSTGSYLLIKAFVDEMIANRFGRIVTMSSVTAQHGGGVFSKTLYAAAKAANLGLMRGLARELARYNVTANAVAPGAVDTDIRAGATSPEREAELSASVPLGRQASADDIAAGFAYFASADGAYLTGVTLNINGGSYIA